MPAGLARRELRCHGVAERYRSSRAPYLLRDRDGMFGRDFVDQVTAFGMS